MDDFDYPAFLAARLDEQERHLDFIGPSLHEGILRYERADIAAKRAILDEYRELETYAVSKGIYRTPAADAAYAQLHARLEDIAILCRPFADHDDWPGDTE